MVGGRHERWLSAALVVSVLTSVVPVLVAGIRATRKDWLPVGDPGFIAMQAHEAISTDPPLLGMPSSATPDPDEAILHHPGPLQFDLLALPTQVLGRGAGVALTTALLNVAAIVALIWLVRRTFGRLEAVVAAMLSALLVWSMGSEVLYDPWPTHTTVLPSALFLVAAWCALAGQPWALPVLVLAGSYAAQTHLAYSVLVPGIAAITGGVLLARYLRHRRSATVRDPNDSGWPAKRARTRRVAAVTSLVALACWAKPLAQQLAHGSDGNLIALARDASGEGPNPSLGGTLRAVGGVFALPPAWLPPSFRRPPFMLDGSGPPAVLALAGLAALGALLGVLGWRAQRRGATGVAAGTALAGAAVLLGLVTVMKVPTEYMGLSPVYIRWLWGLGMVVWLVIGVAFIDELRQSKLVRTTRPGSPSLHSVRVAAGCSVVAVLAGLAAIPAADNGSVTRWWAVDAMHDIDDDLIDAVGALDQPMVLELEYSWTSIFLGPALAGRLQDEGIPFVTSNRVIGEQMGAGRYAAPDELVSGTRLRLRQGPEAPEEDERALLSWQSLTDEEQEELDELSSELAAAIGQHGVTPTTLGASILDMFDLEHIQAELHEWQNDPEALLASSRLWKMVRDDVGVEAHRKLIDDSAYPPGLLDRWAELAERRDLANFTLYAVEIS